MPRILPRLLKTVAAQRSEQTVWPDFKPRRHRPKSLYRPVPPRPSFNPAHYSKSILLADDQPNPITAYHLYVRHKTRPPILRLRNAVDESSHDAPREMSAQERQWWSSPYLRMLASPIRKCVLTTRCFPNDFLLRFAIRRVSIGVNPAAPKLSGDKTTIMPELQHPKYSPPGTGAKFYVVCNKRALSLLFQRPVYKRFSSDASLHPLFIEQVGHLLRLRVLQELQLLVKHMESASTKTHQGSSSPIVRRLTRDEWVSVKNTGVAPYPNAVAVLVVPPLNKDSKGKERPEGSMSASPLPPDDILPSSKPAPLLSILYPTVRKESSSLHDDMTPQGQVPLYNSLTMFPARQQRAALHSFLIRMLGIEQRWRRGIDSSGEVNELKAKTKASHAFLLSSDSEIAKKGDIVPLAVALWRVRMFEGGGWDSLSHTEWLTMT